MKLKKKEIEGIPMLLDLKDHGISNRLYKNNGREFAFMWILRKEASGVAYDVGANIGYCTLNLAKVCKKVVAFEPDKRNLKLLRKNIELNKLENVLVLTHPITNVNKVVRFYQKTKPNASRISKKGKEKCEAHSIDYLVTARLDFPNFIKMDIEGGEVNALRGAMQTLKDAKKMKILIEVHPTFYNKKNNFRAVLEDVLKLGYKFKYVVNAEGKTGEFKNYKLIKSFKQYVYRSVFEGAPEEKVLKWATEMSKDDKKVVRSILLVKK